MSSDNKDYGGMRGGAQSIEQKILNVISDIQRNGFSTASPFSIGSVDSDLKAYADANGIELGSIQMYMSPKQIAHTMRDLHKDKGIDIPPETLAAFPGNRHSMNLYHDTERDNFVYFDGGVKYVVQPNYTLKLPSGKEKVVNFITAYRATSREFGKRNYIKIR